MEQEIRGKEAMSGKLSDEEKRGLIETALQKLSASYAPYSHFHVAAALLTKTGRVYTGVNVENASYPAANCAERSAFFQAVGEGERKFRAIAVCGGTDGRVTDYCPPCGVCRQVMQEFCSPDEFLILAAKTAEDYKEFTLNQLLPFGFGPENLGR